MIKGTPDLIADRRETIINACETLYQSMSFREITLKEIGNLVPFSRPTIYNYFQTKEEIFLALFKREYDRWNAALEQILMQNDRLSPAALADSIARTLEERTQLLKGLTVLTYAWGSMLVAGIIPREMDDGHLRRESRIIALFVVFSVLAFTLPAVISVRLQELPSAMLLTGWSTTGMSPG